MSEKLDAILQRIAELEAVVKEHKDDGATLAMDKIKETLEALVEEKVKAQAAEAPIRRGVNPAVADVIYAGENLKEGNRYRRLLKDFAANGYSKFGSYKVRPIDLWLAHKVMKEGHFLMPGRAPAPSDDLAEAVKALTSTGSGTGDELVPTDMAAQLWEDFFLASRVANLLTVIPMPTNPFDVPLGLGDVTWRKGTENTATTASDPATAKSTLTATELVTEQNWSYTLDEDAVIAMAPAIRARLAISGAEIIDAFALNADGTNAATGNINLDDADPSDDSYYLSDGQDGIRHLWLVDNTDQAVDAGGDALADADVIGGLVKMGKYAVNPEQCMIVCDVSTYLKGFLGDMDGVQTLDKIGSKAVLLTGQLAAYRGIPIVVSASHPLAEADGKVSTTAANNTLGSLSIVNRNMWYVGFRRELLIEVDRDIQKRQYIMVTSLREAVAARGTRSSATHTAGVYNILV